MTLILSIFSFILGTVIASFSGVVIYRVPRHMSIVTPGSMCPSCHSKIKWYDNVPILSYIILKGRCRNCKANIGASSLVLELLGGICFLLAFLRFRLSIMTIIAMLAIWILLIIAFIDLDSHNIYDFSLYIFLVVAIGNVVYNGIKDYHSLYTFAIGFAVGLIFFLLIRIIGGKILHQECLGLGDVYLMAIAGLMLGWQLWVLAVLISSVVGAIISIILIKIGAIKRDGEIPFCPFLVMGIIISLLCGNTLIAWYLGLVL